MIKAKHHVVIYPLFKGLSRFLLKRTFNSLQLEGILTDVGGSVLLIANHISWWDGFWVEYLNQRVFKRVFHFMMLEEQLKKHWYFRFTGGYSVKIKSRDVLKSLAYTIQLLSHRSNMVLMFPQGKIHSGHTAIVHFEKGIQAVVDGCPDTTQVVFLANFTDYFSDPKPNLCMYAQQCSASELKHKSIEEAYNRHYTSALNTHQKRTS